MGMQPNSCKWVIHTTDDPRQLAEAITWHTISCRDNLLTRYDPREITFCPYCGGEIEKEMKEVAAYG